MFVLTSVLDAEDCLAHNSITYAIIITDLTHSPTSELTNACILVGVLITAGELNFKLWQNLIVNITSS